MKRIATVGAMQRLAQSWQQKQVPVGFVPTMGYLHAGHLSLVKEARRLVGPKGQVVLSIYVNPTQFAPTEDLSRYPRDLGRDLQLCRQAGVDVVFAPSNEQMYPAAPALSTFVAEEQLSRRMEGAARPSHFRGVTTIVAKLLNLVRPQVAVFGAKDFQQAAIIQRMVRDLNFAVRIRVAPIVREADGLAMSSRNKFLIGDLRSQALVLSQAIGQAQRLVRQAPGPLSAARLKAKLVRQLQRAPAARVDYVEFFDPKSLEPSRRVGRGSHLALAVYIGQTRLIDNASL